MAQQLSNEEQQKIAAGYVAELRDFHRRAQELGLDDTADYLWYHTVDLGAGLVTPGLYDFRSCIDDFGFPAEMTAMTALDVGSATGFFAFEFERRGASVVSVELPSLRELDRFPGQSVEDSLAKIEKMVDPKLMHPAGDRSKKFSAEEYYFNLLEGPFRFCAKRLGSRVQRCYSTIYDLSPEKLGRPGFDFVFLGDILLHTLYPLRALAAAAAMCTGTLVLSQHIPENGGRGPAMLWVGGDDPREDEVSWWWPNKACLVAMLKKLDFAEVTELGRHNGVLKSSGFVYERTLLRATR